MLLNCPLNAFKVTFFKSDRSHNITQLVLIIFTNAQVSLSFLIMITIDMLSVTGEIYTLQK